MATVNSLLCWGGATGKTVASINTSTDVLTITNHGLRSGAGVQFDSWVAAPTVSGTALALNTTYYAKAVTDANSFELYYDSGLTSKINFTATGTTLVLKSAWLKGLSDTSRWGSRIYDGLASWNAGRAGASEFDIEVAEIGEAFAEIIAADLNITVPSAQNRIETKINGVRTAAFHNGKVGATLLSLTLAHGYVLYCTTCTTSVLKISRQRDIIDGISNVLAAGVSRSLYDIGAACTVQYSVAHNSTGASGTGIILRSAYAAAIGCLIYRVSLGVSLPTSQSGIMVANCGIFNCTSALNTATSVIGYFYNNVTDVAWPTQPTALNGAAGNAGPSGGAPWTINSNPTYVVATTDYANYASQDFRPLNASSPQVDHGVLFYGYPDRDLKLLERPAYNNGGSEAIDIGPFEFDLGFGSHPATADLTISGVVSGSAWRVEKASDGTLISSGTATGGDIVVSGINYPGSPLTLRVRVRKGTSQPKYQPFETLTVLTAAGGAAFVTQVPDTIAS